MRFHSMSLKKPGREDRYSDGKLKTWKEHIRTNFHGQDVPYNIHYIEECKYNDAENQQCSMLSDDDDGFFEG